jgi:hypothetical protein
LNPVTASFDITAKVMSDFFFYPVYALLGHEAKGTSLDIRADGRDIATVSNE